MGYSRNESVVRADRFRPSGKWYDTFELDMSQEYDALNCPEAVLAALKRNKLSYLGWIIVVLEPSHANAYPVCIADGFVLAS